MRISSLRENLLGTVAARPVYDESLRMLVNQGAALDETLVENLRKRGYKYIYIQEEGTEDIQVIETFSVDASRAVAREVDSTFSQVRKLSGGEKTALQAVFKRLSMNDRFKNLAPKGSFRKNVMKFVQDIYYRNVDTIGSFALSMLGANPLSHAMDVTILSVLLGKRFFYSLKELTSLATASLLHDAGLQLFPDICMKPYLLFTDEERAIYYEHSSLGFELLNTLECFNAMETQTVLQHHENQDGTGFPLGYRGGNEKPLRARRREKGFIFRWAEIAAVADKYVNYCAGNLTEIPMNPASAVAKVIEDSGDQLNSAVVGELVKLINVFPLGMPVKIADSMDREIIGYKGVVSKENPLTMDRPEVILLRSRKGQKITPRKVDLARDKAAELELDM